MTQQSNFGNSQIVAQWITSLAISVICCAVLFIVFAGYIVELHSMTNLTMVRLEVLQDKNNQLTSEVNILKRLVPPPQIQPQVAPQPQASAPAPVDPAAQPAQTTGAQPVAAPAPQPAPPAQPSSAGVEISDPAPADPLKADPAADQAMPPEPLGAPKLPINPVHAPLSKAPQQAPKK